MNVHQWFPTGGDLDTEWEEKYSFNEITRILLLIIMSLW